MIDIIILLIGNNLEKHILIIKLSRYSFHSNIIQLKMKVNRMDDLRENAILKVRLFMINVCHSNVCNSFTEHFSRWVFIRHYGICFYVSSNSFKSINHFIIAMMQIQTSIISKIIFAIKRTLFEHPEVALRVDFNKINLGMFPLSYYIHEINPNAFCSVLLHLYYRL